MTITIDHIDQVYVLQESLEGSRSKTAKAVLAEVEAKSSRSSTFTINVDDPSVVIRSLRKFIAKCDPVRHWRAVDAAVALCRS